MLTDVRVAVFILSNQVCGYDEIHMTTCFGSFDKGWLFASFNFFSGEVFVSTSYGTYSTYYIPILSSSVDLDSNTVTGFGCIVSNISNVL